MSGVVTLRLNTRQLVSDSIPLSFCVNRRLERFIYAPTVVDAAVPIAYIENPSLSSTRDLHLTEFTYLVQENAYRGANKTKLWDSFYGKSYTSIYRDILATNIVITDEGGNLKPLFHAHRIPSDTVSVDLYIVQNGTKQEVETGYLVDLDRSAVYTNYYNFYDEISGSYRVYFLIVTTASGKVRHEILNVTPAAREATWEDLDLDLGTLREDIPVFSKETTVNGTTYTFAKTDTWYVKTMDTSLIQVQPPSGRTSMDYWYLKMTNGDFIANVNNAVRHYYIPEFDTQNFAPYKPLLFSQIERVLYVNSRILKVTRNNIHISPETDMHMLLTVRNPDGVLIAAWSTDPALHGKRYSGSVFYQSDVIASYDNATGFISVGLDLLPSWDVSASYFYSASDFEYTAVNLNPSWNPAAFEYSYVFYVIPNVNTTDQAVHHLAIDKSGVIVATSQSAGIAYPNFQLYNQDGTYNSNTIIGSLYASEDSECFLRKYTAGFDNHYGYSVLAVASVSNFAAVENQEVIDVRRQGDTLVEATKQLAFEANPRLLQSIYGYGVDGQIVPKDAVVIIDTPITLLNTYGGTFTEDLVEDCLTKNLPAAVYPVVNWMSPRITVNTFGVADFANKFAQDGIDNDIPPNELLPQLLAEYFTPEGVPKIHFNVVWGGCYIYRLYHRTSDAAQWELLQQWDGRPLSAVSDPMFYSHSPQPNQYDQYKLVLVSNDIELPASWEIQTVSSPMTIGGGEGE